VAQSRITRSNEPQPDLVDFLELDSINIAAWCPDPDAQQPPEQVHLILRIQALAEFSFLVRFKSPATLAFLIEELIRYRREVWPDAPPLDVDLNELRCGRRGKNRVTFESCT